MTEGLSHEMAALPEHVRRSLTWDREWSWRISGGHGDHGVKVYFADPQSPWQRGTNENTNRLLRQYFPKGVTMKDLTQAELNHVAAKFNARPRKTLDFDTPATRFAALLR